MNVPIISDSIIEGIEMFSGNLATTAPRVTLDPDVTQITITDFGCKSENLNSSPIVLSGV